MIHDSTARLYQAAAERRQIQDPAELALILAVSQQTVRNWEQRGISKKGLQEARQVLGVSPEWLQTGEGAMWDTPIASINTSPQSPQTPTKMVLDLREFALQRLGLDGNHIIHHIVNHDNMFNTLAVGDTVLINTQIRDYIGSGIYAVNTPAGMMIYRINQFQNGFLMLIHDNPAYPPEMMRPDELAGLQMIGRVVGKYGVVAL